MRKTQFEDDEMMDFDTDIMPSDNLEIKTQNGLSTNTNGINENITGDSNFINFHSKANNSYKIVSSYDINQMTQNEKHSILKIKINNNISNEMVLINSNFQLLYMSLKEDNLFHVCSFNKEHQDRINDVTFFENGVSPFDRAFISAGSDGTIKVWDSRTQSSVKSISTNGKKVFTVDTNQNILVAGMEREIGVWDLKMMKQIHKVKFAHSEDVTFVKLRNNILLTGGEDSIVNIFDLENGFTMDSVIVTANIGQPIASLGFLDDEFNFLQVITTVQTYHIFNMFTGIPVFEFDSKNDIFKTDYILDSYYNKQKNNIDLVCGNFYGDISLFTLPITHNVKDMTLVYDSLIKTNVIQTFNSVERLPNRPTSYLSVSDEGLLYIIDKKSEMEKANEELNHLQLLDENKQGDNFELEGNGKEPIGRNDLTIKIHPSGSKITGSKKRAITNKFSPY